MQSRLLLFVMLWLSMAVPVLAQEHLVDGAPLVDRKAGRPMLFAFDVEPGYFNHVLVPAEEGDDEDTKTLRISLEPPSDAEWVDGHWNPTVFLCLQPAVASKQSYCANLDVDRLNALRSFGSARLRSESGDVLSRKLTSGMFEQHAAVELRVVRKGQHVTTKFNGETIDEADIGFAPAFWMIGASTGVAMIKVIDEVEVPLGPGEWPTTMEAAVALELEYLSGNSKATIRGMRKTELATLQVGWGSKIRDRQGLARGNTALIEAACGKGCAPDVATMRVMEAVWVVLQAPSRQR